MKIRKIAGLFITTMVVTTICSGCNKNEVAVNDNYNNDKEIIEVSEENVKEELNKDVVEENIEETADKKVENVKEEPKKEVLVDYSSISSIEDINKLFETNLSKIKSKNKLRNNVNATFDNIYDEAFRISSLLSSLKGTEKYNEYMNKCVILSDFSNHINRGTANEILEYLVGAFEVTSLIDNHTTGYSMFLAKVLMDYYTIHLNDLEINSELQVISHQMYSICSNVNSGDLYDLEYYQENIRELLSALGW